ncbi:MAG: hypothetical protein ACLFMO_05790 [Eubacteriales bacterium]
MDYNTYDKDQEVVDTEQNKFCPSCGGTLTFSPETQSLECGACGNHINIEENYKPIHEYDFSKAEEFEYTDWGASKKVIQCKTCGGETIVDSNENTVNCAFCGAEHLVEVDDNLGMKPESLIPFKFDDSEAKNKFKQWINKRWLSPGDLKDSYNSNKLTGVYMPFWTFDSLTQTHYSVRIGDRHYRTTADGKRESYYKYRSKSGRHQKFFDDVLVSGSKDENRKLLRKIEPFYTKELVAYQPSYLAGFQAERYVVGPKDAFEEAKGKMKKEIEKEIKSRLGGDTYENFRTSIDYEDISFKHILLPLYISSYKYKDKTYNFLINGQTGEVQGQAPLSPLKIAIIAVIAIAIIALIFLIKS